MDDRQLLKLIAALLGLLAGAAVFAALYFAQSVIVPFALALFAAFAVEPLVRTLQRFRVPRPVGALVTVGLIFVVVQATAAIVGAAVEELQMRLPLYLASLQEMLDRLPLPEGARGAIHVDDPSFWTELLPVKAVVGSVGDFTRAVTSFVANAMLVLLLMVALIIGRRSFDERLDRAAGTATGRLEQTARVIDAIDAGIQRYMLLKTLLSVGFGLTFWAVLNAFSVDLAILWSFLAFILNYIPTVGPIIASAPPIGLVFLQYGGNLGYALVGALAVVAIPFVFGNLIEPKVFGDSLNLNFFAVLFALLLWSFLWGIPGAVLSVPIMMAVSVVCREVPALRPIHELLRT